MVYLDKNGLQTLTNKLVQGEAIKVASHRGHTVKNVVDNITRECENVATPNTIKFENNISEFKIGKGRDIDVSGDVEEGKVEVELKGKTWFDVVGTNSFKINQEQALEYRYQYFGIRTKPNFEQHGDKTYFRLEFEKIQMDNDDNTACVLSHRDDGGYTIRILNNSQLKSKPFNTPITVSMIRTRNTNEGGTYQSFFIQNHGEFTHNIQFKFKVLGCVCINLTQYFGKGNEPTKEWCDKNIPYFTGIKSSFEDAIVDIEIIENKKNLLDMSRAIYYDCGINDIIGKDIRLCKGFANPNRIQDCIPIKPNTFYTISITKDNSSFEAFIGTADINYIGITNNLIWKGLGGDKKTTFTFKSGYNARYMFFNAHSNYDIFIEESDYAPSYEVNNKKKISFNIGEPLRSLPNGVCDEIRNNNGQWELVRRISKEIINGSESWTNNIQINDGNIRTWQVIKSSLNNKFSNVKKEEGGNVINYFSNKMMSVSYQGTTESISNINSDILCFAFKNLSKNFENEIQFKFPKTMLSDYTVTAIKQWFAANPTTVYYELETPVITPIEPIEFNIKPLSTMNIKSDIAPTSTHTVILNRAGQIERGILEIAELKKRVDNLEMAYDSYLLETQHKLCNLGFDYELESEEI